MLLYVMNVFTITFISISLQITNCIKLNKTFLKDEAEKSPSSGGKWSKLYMEEKFLPSYKKEKVELILEEHNKYRDLHRVPRLELDCNITHEAEIWAELLTSIRNPKVNHNINYGENIWIKETEDIKSFMTVDHLNPVRTWYNEIVNYTGPFEPAKNTRSFTQLVWRSSKKLGVGFTYSALVLYVVCYYDPPGNIFHTDNKYISAALFHDNVLPPKNSTVKWSDLPRPTSMWLIFAIIFLIVTIVLLIIYRIFHCFYISFNTEVKIIPEKILNSSPKLLKIFHNRLKLFTNSNFLRNFDKDFK